MKTATHGSTSETTEIGSVIADRYILNREIATGGMATVFAGVHRYAGHRVALKLLLPELRHDATLRERLIREARTLALIEHPGVPRIMDAGTCPMHGTFIVMELLEGRSLDGILAARRRLAIDETVQLGLHVCAVLSAVHRVGVVHRDIKPGNLFIARRATGDVEHVKLIDFGISQVPLNALMPGAQRLTAVDRVLGTIEYMSREQMSSNRDVDQRADIYSLAVTLFECLTGDVPTSEAYDNVLAHLTSRTVGNALSLLRPEVPATLAAVIERGMAPRADDRYANVEAFANALTDATQMRYARLAVLEPAAVRAAPAVPVVPSEPATAERPAAPLPMVPHDQRRVFKRAPYLTPIRIVFKDGQVIDARTEDISEGGILIVARAKFTCPQGEGVKVRFAAPPLGVIVTVDATVRWLNIGRHGGATGLEFVALPADIRESVAKYVNFMSAPAI